MKKYRMTREEWILWRQNAGDFRQELKNRVFEAAGKLRTKILNPAMKIVAYTQYGEFEGPTQGAALGVASSTSVPSPDACLCKAYAGTEPGKHHKVCQHRLQWEQGQGIKTLIVDSAFSKAVHTPASATVITTNTVQHLALPAIQTGMPHAIPTAMPNDKPGGFVESKAPGVKALPPPVVKKIPSPAECVCKEFARPTPKPGDPPVPDNMHHPICQHFDEWNKQNAGQSEKLYLLDLETRVVMREATSDEIRESQEEEKQSGTPTVRIDDKLYGVVPAPVGTGTSPAPVGTGTSPALVGSNAPAAV